MCERDRTRAREKEHTRMDVSDKKRMPDTDVGEFVVAEPLSRQVPRGITVLDQNGNATGADGVNLFLHETRNGDEIAALPKREESTPKGADGASRKRREVIDRRKPKLEDVIEQFDVAVLEFKPIFRWHVGWCRYDPWAMG